MTRQRLAALLILGLSAPGCASYGPERPRHLIAKVEPSSPTYSPVPRVTVTPLPPAPKDPTLAELAARLDFKVEIDMKEGKRFLVDGDERVVILPGKREAVVNGVTVAIAEPVMWDDGVLRAPAGLESELSDALEKHAPRRKPVATWSPASHSREATPKPQAVAVPKPTAAPLPGLPSEVDFPASRSWEYIVIHHSATDAGGAVSFHRSHAKKWRWGLGYHFVVGNGTETGVGVVEVGARWRLQNKGVHGAHAGVKTYNEHGIGICLVGNFQTKGPSETQLRALAALCKALMARYKIPASRVLGHKHARPKHTECPGKHFPWERFRAML